MRARSKLMLDWLLLSARGRMLRRWSFLVTVPLAVLAAVVVGFGTSLAVLVGRLALWLAVVGLAWRLGGERGEAVRDLLMHPRLRRFIRTELRVLTAPARLLRRQIGEFGYHHGDEGMPIFFALVPVVVSEAVVLHLLLPGGWLWVHVAAAVLHLYALVWLFGWAFGPRLRPHRVSDGVLHVHGGLLYTARVPLASIRGVEVTRRRVGDRGFHCEGDAALLPARRRVDLWLDLSEAVSVALPLGEPVEVTRLGIAADDPQALAAALALPPAAGEPQRPAVPGLGVAVGLPELVYGSG